MKRYLIAFLLFTAIFSIISMIGAIVFFNNYFGRNELGENHIELRYSDVSSDLYPRETVDFYSANTLLRGYLYGKNNTKGTIIFAHGIDSGSDTYLTTIMSFVDKGWTVFAFDGTGTRESSGKGIRGLSQTKIDIHNAINFVYNNELFGNKPIFLYGHSMGGYAVLAVLAEEVPVEGVISIAPFNSPNETMLYQLKQYLGPLAYLEYPFFAFQHHLTFYQDSNISAVEGINSSFDVPILIVVGTDDEIVPFDTIDVYAHRREIKREKEEDVEFFIIREEFRNKHMTTWLSQEAARYHMAVTQSNIPIMLNREQRIKINEVDPTLMDMFSQFLDDAARSHSK